MKARAKHDVKVLMEDNCLRKNKKGNEYRCIKHCEDMVLIDENKRGYRTDMKSFDEDFEIV